MFIRNHHNVNIKTRMLYNGTQGVGEPLAANEWRLEEMKQCHQPTPVEQVYIANQKKNIGRQMGQTTANWVEGGPVGDGEVGVAGVAGCYAFIAVRGTTECPNSKK